MLPFFPMTLLFVAIVVTPGEEQPHANLIYERHKGAENCPDAQNLQDRVSARLGYVPFDDHAVRRIRVDVRREINRYSAQLESETNGQKAKPRVLSSAAADCSELADALALAISVAIDPLSITRVVEAAPSTPEPPPAPPPPREPTPPIPQLTNVVVNTGDEQPTWHYYAHLAPVASFGMHPDLAGGFSAAMGVQFLWGRLSLEPQWFVPQQSHLKKTAVRTQNFSLDVVPCFQQKVLLGCLIVSNGWLSARGVDVRDPHTGTAYYSNLGLGVGASIPVWKNLLLFGRLDGRVALRRPAFDIDNQQIWRAPAVSAYVRMGVAGVYP